MKVVASAVKDGANAADEGTPVQSVKECEGVLRSVKECEGV